VVIKCLKIKFTFSGIKELFLIKIASGYFISKGSKKQFNK